MTTTAFQLPAPAGELEVIYSQQLDFRPGGSEQVEGTYTPYMTEEERASNNIKNASAKSIAETPDAVHTDITMIICHPHPLFGGTMHNKVVTTLAKVANELAIPSVRFNFRGVGKSTGQYDDGVGEIDDLQAIVAWVKQTWPHTRLWLSGFSFGSYIAAEVATTGIAERVISIAPPATRWHFQEIVQMPCPWLVVQGDADEVVEPDAVFEWFAAQHPQAEMIRMNGASHFFHGRLIELRELLINKLGPVL